MDYLIFVIYLTNQLILTLHFHLYFKLLFKNIIIAN